MNNVSREGLLENYWMFHPRFKFFKSVPKNAVLLDVGAGSGGLVFWRNWSPKGTPIRTDITMYGVSIEKGTYFDEYTGYQILDLDVENIMMEKMIEKRKEKKRKETFSVIIMSHILEHLKDERRILREINMLLEKEGYLYIELPSIETYSMPKSDHFKEQGIPVEITNFYEDLTHKRTFPHDVLLKLVAESGFRLIENGVIRNPYLENELISYAKANNDSELALYGVWSQLEWAQYVIAQKI